MSLPADHHVQFCNISHGIASINVVGIKKKKKKKPRSWYLYCQNYWLQVKKMHYKLLSAERNLKESLNNQPMEKEGGS